ncbi:MAG: hydrogenase maturation protease [Bacteroidota bacterium]|nr:hydrogenase maturation protease [Bacteroidota bacterium]
MTDKKTLILGLGNEILSDDGIGPKLIKDLSRMLIEPGLHFEASSCGGLEIMEYISDFERVVFIDAIRTRNGNPGEVYYFIPSDFRETSNLSNLHDVNFLTALRLGKFLEMDLPSDLHIIAVEIIEDMTFSEELTPALNKKYPQVLVEVLDIIRRIINT